MDKKWCKGFIQTTFDTMSQAAAWCEISKDDLREFKAEGSIAFRGSRVYLIDLLRWLAFHHRENRTEIRRLNAVNGSLVDEIEEWKERHREELAKLKAKLKAKKANEANTPT